MYGLKPIPSMLKPVLSMPFMPSTRARGVEWCGFVYGEYCREDGLLGSSASFSAMGGGKLLETFVAWRAIDPGFNLGTIPEATATFANFQMYAQFHDYLSGNVCRPAD